MTLLLMSHGILAGNLNPGKHNFVVVSYFLCLSSSMEIGPGPNFIELLQQKSLNKYLLGRNASVIMPVLTGKF